MSFLSNMFRWRYLPSVNRTWQVVSRLVFSHDSISKKAFQCEEVHLDNGGIKTWL